MQKHEIKRRLRAVPRTESKKTLQTAFLLMCEAVNSPVSLKAHLLFREGKYDELVSMEVNPDNYSDAKSFADDYLVSKFLSKFPNFSHENLDPEAKAERDFHAYEEMCRVTNIKFKKLEEDPSLWDPFMREVFSLAKRKISFILREPKLNDIAHHFGWGPGANTSASGSYTSAYVKFGSRLDVTSNALMMGQACVNSLPSWVNCQLKTDCYPSVEASLLKEAFNIVRGNEIVFVPKNAKTHRVIAKEPSVNSYLQKGFGTMIRECLRTRASVDLKDQTVNQRLAKEGSLTGLLATIDLSGASDTISRELVRYLLPGKWYSLLDQIRSKQGRIKNSNTWLHFQKFSSMGNACTFELESLIFYALCKACLEVSGGEQTCNVYGDDIIVPTEHYESVVKVIDYAGFKVNLNKSYSKGNFRESCGKDYFLGTDVRPIFLKEEISNVESIFKLANSVRRYSHRRNSHYGCDLRFRSVWDYLIDRLDPNFRKFYISDGFGDCGLVVNFDEASPTLRRPKDGWGGFLFKAIIRLPVKRVMENEQVAYATLLSVIGSEEPLLGHHDLRKSTYPKETRIHTQGWCDLGPWQ